MNQIKLFQSIKDKVATLNRTLIITIDGCAGAGKTTLAEKIEADFEDVVTIHMDDLYRGWLLTLGPTLTRELISILDQLSEGGVVTYNKFDWHNVERSVSLPFLCLICYFNTLPYKPPAIYF